MLSLLSRTDTNWSDSLLPPGLVEGDAQPHHVEPGRQFTLKESSAPIIVAIIVIIVIVIVLIKVMVIVVIIIYTLFCIFGLLLTLLQQCFYRSCCTFLQCIEFRVSIIHINGNKVKVSIDIVVYVKQVCS